MIAPFAHHFLRGLAQSLPVRSIILAVAALSGPAIYDARFSISDLRHTIPAALLLHAFTIDALNRVTQLLTLNFRSPDISHALVVIAASILTVPLHVFGRATSLFPPYPYIPFLALLPLPFLSSLLLFYPSRTLSSSLQYRSSFTLSYIPTLPSSHHYSLDVGHGLTSVSFPFPLFIQARRDQPATTGPRPWSQSPITVLPLHHPCISRVPQDLLLPVAESFVHASANALWSME
jgi:hypothetical protein